MLELIGLAVGSVTSAIGLYASYIEISNHRVSKRLDRAAFESLPVQIRKSITYSQLLRGIKLAQVVCDEIRFPPEVIIGIHYNGLSFAALLAKEMYKPIHHASVHYDTRSGRHVCDQVRLSLNCEEFRGKRVLIVDNSMETGNTMNQVRKQLEDAGAHVKTLIFYQKKNRLDPTVVHQPDIVLFRSKNPLKAFLV